MPLLVTPVETKAALASFIALPRRLYAGLPGYVPTLDLERRGLLHPKAAAIFKSGKVRYFLATRDGATVGRISAQIDPDAIAQWGAPIGLFGALDAVDDSEVVARLLDAATTWLSQQGMHLARGPYLLTPNGESGLMVSGQVARHMIMMPWHPAYLAAHVEQLDWTKAMDLFAYEVAVDYAALATHVISRVRLGRADVTIRAMRPRHMAEDAEILRRIYNEAWQDNWGFIPISPAEISAMIKEMRPILRPAHYVLVERQGEPLAVALIVPNIYDLMDGVGGAPSPLGWVRLAWRLFRGQYRSARLILLGVVPRLHGTILGGLLPALIIKEIMQRGKQELKSIRFLELGWVLESNTRMRRLAESFAPVPSKRYRLYEKALLPAFRHSPELPESP